MKHEDVIIEEREKELGDRFDCRFCGFIWHTLNDDRSERLEEFATGDVCPNCEGNQLNPLDEEDPYDLLDELSDMSYQ